MEKRDGASRDRRVGLGREPIDGVGGIDGDRRHLDRGTGGQGMFPAAQVKRGPHPLGLHQPKQSGSVRRPGPDVPDTGLGRRCRACLADGETREVEQWRQVAAGLARGIGARQQKRVEAGRIRHLPGQRPDREQGCEDRVEAETQSALGRALGPEPGPEEEDLAAHAANIARS